MTAWSLSKPSSCAIESLAQPITAFKHERSCSLDRVYPAFCFPHKSAVTTVHALPAIDSIAVGDKSTFPARGLLALGAIAVAASARAGIALKPDWFDWCRATRKVAIVAPAKCCSSPLPLLKLIVVL